MAPAMRVFRKFQSSDGRIKIATLSGVSVLVAVIALLVGVLPVFATAPGPSGEGVVAVPVDWGGGSGACDDDLNRLDDGTARGPSAANYEAHLNNPTPGTHVLTDSSDPNETEITITVDENAEFFEFSIEPGMVAYDVVVNGGKKSNHYTYDGDPGIGPSDSHLSAPTKDNKQPLELHNLSHINLCYDTATVTFACGGTAKSAFRFGDGEFTVVTGSIFANSLNGCTEDKSGLFFIDNTNTGDVDPNVKLDFGDDPGTPTVAGLLEVTKVFVDGDDDDSNPDFEALKFAETLNETPVVLDWCETRRFADGDGTEFSEWLPTGTEDGLYPSLPNGATACKVAEEEDLSGRQVTVVYFEFVDPHFF